MAFSIFEFIVIALAAWRLAYLVARERAPFDVMTKIRERTTLGGLLTCIYCASVWTAALCYALWFTPFQFVVVIAAVSGAALMLGSYTGASQSG